ncbi:synaptotagmin-C-like [Paramacrobiotus metropolitanus]|uniref:synaptotagmin-C-like n=1 Tax=Paramacrobiotus metropolitanus TaxID=2943436 RepID=UPI0024461111|nr:synaptotagmin-C-like [Paramacrobiotus metropolitanus]
MRQYDGGDRSPAPGGRTLFGQQRGGRAEKVEEDEVYVPKNQLAPPSPSGILARKKSTTSSGHHPVSGDILLRMTYERCTLTLQVLRARNLKAADKTGFSDPYCKILVVPGRAEYKYRTRHIQQNLNPEWKETFTFQGIDPNEIHHKKIEITVWDWDRLSADDFLGEVIVDLTGIQNCSPKIITNQAGTDKCTMHAWIHDIFIEVAILPQSLWQNSFWLFCPVCGAK